VITIFLDEERFLKDAIDSVLAQQYPSWELLLVDDGSVDASTTLAGRFAAKEPRIRYLHHPQHENRGMSASRNLALRHAQGEYLAFLDADDAWFPDTLEQQIALFDRHPEAAMVCGTAEWWQSWAGADAVGGDSCDVVATRAPLRDAPIDPPAFATAIVADGAVVPCPCTVAVRAACLQRVGGFEDSFRGLYEDQVLYAKIGLEWPVVVTSQCLGRYRQHEDQCCVRAAQAGTVHDLQVRFLSWLADYVAERGVHDRDLQRAMDNARANA
jgi:glycosyltransferase involved in cell wall biosynthesis